MEFIKPKNRLGSLKAMYIDQGKFHTIPAYILKFAKQPCKCIRSTLVYYE